MWRPYVSHYDVRHTHLSDFEYSQGQEILALPFSHAPLWGAC